MSEKIMLQFIQFLGVVATIVLGAIVVYLNDGGIWSTLAWLVPLLVLIEFGCFAYRDLTHMEKGKHDIP